MDPTINELRYVVDQLLVGNVEGQFLSDGKIIAWTTISDETNNSWDLHMEIIREEQK